MMLSETDFQSLKNRNFSYTIDLSNTSGFPGSVLYFEISRTVLEILEYKTLPPLQTNSKPLKNGSLSGSAAIRNIKQSLF